MEEVQINHNSPTSIKKMLEDSGFTPQKKFGQNFLVSEDVRRKIISLLDIENASTAWEIGPGLGAMTDTVLEKSKIGSVLTLFEIDRGYCAYLREKYKNFIESSSIEIIEGDMIKTWKSCYRLKGKPDIIFGNLPYNAAAAIIASVIEENAVPEKMVFTVQKEVAQRMAESPGKKDFSSFSVLCQAACSVNFEFEIEGSAFFPQPDVVSAVVTLTPLKDPYDIDNWKSFSSFLRILFNSRRKTVFNNLKKEGKETAASALEEAGISPGIRADNLETGQIVNLFNIVKNKRQPL